MAYETLDFLIRPEDGWVEVAENPVNLIVRPSGFHPWWLAVTDGTAPNVATTIGEGTLTFTGQPSNTQTVTINGVAYRAVTAYHEDTPGARDFLIGGDAEGTIDNLVEIINGRAIVAAGAATGTVTISGGVPIADEEVVIGDDTYVFKALAAAPFEVTIGGDAAITATNMISVINDDDTSGVTASDGGSGVAALTADVAGAVGNDIVLTEAATNTAVSGAGTLTGGYNAIPAVAANADVRAVKEDTDKAVVSALAPGGAANSITLAETLTNAAWGATEIAGGADPLIGLAFGRGADNAREHFESSGALTGKVFIRVKEPLASYASEKAHFGVVRNGA